MNYKCHQLSLVVLQMLFCLPNMQVTLFSELVSSIIHNDIFGGCTLLIEVELHHRAMSMCIANYCVEDTRNNL